MFGLELQEGERLVLSLLSFPRPRKRSFRSTSVMTTHQSASEGFVSQPKRQNDPQIVAGSRSSRPAGHREHV